MNSQQKKKKWGKKSEFMKRRGKKTEGKSKDCCVTLLSVHAQTSQANILHLDEKARKGMTCKQLCGISFTLAFYSQTMTRKLLNQLPNAFFGKIPRSEWVNTLTVPFYNYFLNF